LAASVADGHFVWLVDRAEQGTQHQLHVYFGEEAAPGDGQLLGNIAATKLWSISPNGEATEIPLKEAKDSLYANVDDKGKATFDRQQSGVYSIRARHIERSAGDSTAGDVNESRHYCTLVPDLTSMAQPEIDNTMQVAYPPMPQPVTSFGGAILGNSLYVYGGHAGQAHQYSTSGQANTLWRLDLTGSKNWTEVCTGPRMQGLALIGYRGKLYRLGGFTARNAEGDEHDLWSRDDVACCDPETGEWQPLPSMPQPRSSFDAALLGDTIYVVGGWNLQGSEDDREWLDTACALDLASTERKWELLPKQPFRRRALSVAAHGGKLYVIGGIQDDGEIATRVDIYDPATGNVVAGTKNPRRIDGRIWKFRIRRWWHTLRQYAQRNTSATAA
jgi:hypothetical protein